MLEAYRTYTAPNFYEQFLQLDKDANDREIQGRTHWDSCLNDLDRTGQDIIQHFGTQMVHCLETDTVVDEPVTVPLDLWDFDPLDEAWPLWAEYRHLRYGSQPAVMAGYLVACRLAIDTAAKANRNDVIRRLRLASIGELVYANFRTSEWNAAARNLIGSDHLTMAESEQIAESVARRWETVRDRWALRRLHAVAIFNVAAEHGFSASDPRDRDVIAALAALLAAASSEPASGTEHELRFEALDLVVTATSPFDPGWNAIVQEFFPVD